MQKKLLIFVGAAGLLAVGLYLESSLLKTLMCLSAGLIFGIGWIADMRDRANETLSKKSE